MRTLPQRANWSPQACLIRQSSTAAPHPLPHLRLAKMSKFPAACLARTAVQPPTSSPPIASLPLETSAGIRRGPTEAVRKSTAVQISSHAETTSARNRSATSAGLPDLAGGRGAGALCWASFSAGWLPVLASSSAAAGPAGAALPVEATSCLADGLGGAKRLCADWRPAQSSNLQPPLVGSERQGVVATIYLKLIWLPGQDPPTRVQFPLLPESQNFTRFFR